MPASVSPGEPFELDKVLIPPSEAFQDTHQGQGDEDINPGHTQDFRLLEARHVKIAEP